MKVWILTTFDYDNTYIEGVYASLEAAQAVYPEATWERREDASGNEYWSNGGMSIDLVTITPHEVKPNGSWAGA